MDTRMTAEARTAILARCARAMDRVSRRDEGLVAALHDIPALVGALTAAEQAIDTLRQTRAATPQGSGLIGHVRTWPRRRADDADAAARFGARVLAAHREHLGDVDGGDLQAWAVEAGLLEARVVSAVCGEPCACAPGDTCYVLTEAGRTALAMGGHRG